MVGMVGAEMAMCFSPIDWDLVLKCLGLFLDSPD